MGKGAILDEGFIHSVGLAEQLLTLTAPIENRHHPVLQEPMFEIKAKEVEGTIYLERRYVFDNQVSIRSTYAAGDKVLVWLARSLRSSPLDAKAPMVEVLMAREFFLLGDWREFQRFKQFVKSMRIVDAQARQWLADHHGDIAQLSQAPEGVAKVLDHLGGIAEWPDMDEHNGNQRPNTLEIIAKTYSKDLLPLRSSAHLPAQLLSRAPDVRFNTFRLLSFVDDPSGPAGLLRFLQGLAAASADALVQEAAKELRSSRDLSRAFAALRVYLLGAR